MSGERVVLVDSSVLMYYLTGLSAVVENLVQTNRAAINPIIRLELLTGVRDDAHYDELADVLRGFHFLPISEEMWRRAERLRYLLRKQGHLVPLADVVIACCAVVNDCELLHADRHFDMIASTIPLRICHLT